MGRRAIDLTNPDSFIQCKICGERLRTLRHHLISKHNMTAAQYRDQYNAPTSCKLSLEKRSHISKTKCIKALEKKLGGKEGMRQQAARAREGITEDGRKRSQLAMVQARLASGRWSQQAQRAAAKRYSDPEEKAKARENMLKAQQIGADKKRIDFPDRPCAHCKTMMKITAPYKYKKFCSVSCKMKYWHAHLTEEQQDAIRSNLDKYSGMADPIFYDGIWYKSRLEVQFAKLMNELNIEFQYEPKSFKYEGSTYGYLVDFYLPSIDVYVETKSNFWLGVGIRKLDRKQIDINRRKFEAVVSAGENLVLIMEKSFRKFKRSLRGKPQLLKSLLYKYDGLQAFSVTYC